MARKSITIRLQSDLVEKLDEEAGNRDISRSEYVREALQDRHRAKELDSRVQSLRKRLDQREKRIATLEEQLARRSQMEDKVDELALQVREKQKSPPFFVRWYQWWQNR